MKIAKDVELPDGPIVKGSTVMVVNNTESNWELIGRFSTFEDTVGSFYIVIDRIRSYGTRETSVQLDNGYWYPESSVIFIN